MYIHSAFKGVQINAFKCVWYRGGIQDKIWQHVLTVNDKLFDPARGSLLGVKLLNEVFCSSISHGCNHFSISAYNSTYYIAPMDSLSLLALGLATSDAFLSTTNP